MVYCSIEEIRDLTGLTDIELDDNQLEEIILNAERLVNSETGKPEGWNPSDTKYPFIQSAAKFYAASLCFQALPETPETEGKNERYRSQAREILKRLQVPITVSSEYEYIKEQ